MALILDAARTRHWLSAAISKILSVCQMGQSDGTLSPEQPPAWNSFAPRFPVHGSHLCHHMYGHLLLSALLARTQGQEAGASTLSPACLPGFSETDPVHKTLSATHETQNGFSLPSEVKTSV